MRALFGSGKRKRSEVSFTGLTIYESILPTFTCIHTQVEAEAVLEAPRFSSLGRYTIALVHTLGDGFLTVHSFYGRYAFNFSAGEEGMSQCQA